MSAHTPGPWALNRTTFDGKLVGWQITADPLGSLAPICTDDPERKGGRSAAEEEANARLIAAAPELLEALQALVTACGDVRPYQMGVVGPERDLPQILKAKRFLDTYERAGKAIAKATGSAT